MTDSLRLLQQFARFPEPGAVKTRLQGELSPLQACAVHEELMLGTLRCLIQAQLAPVELWLDRLGEHPTLSAMLDLGGEGPFEQVPGDLGQRMVAALTKGLERAAQVVLVGSDCPGLDGAYLRRAFDALEGADAVLGPAEDGGYVLIGVRRVVPSMLHGIAWGEGTVLDDTRLQLQKVGLNVALLDSRYDVDYPEDLQRWRREKP